MAFENIYFKFKNMKNSKIITLLAAYFAGSAVNSMYNKKSDSEIKNEMIVAKEEGSSPLKVLFWNFLDVHKRLFSDVKENVVTEENKEKFNEKKCEFKKLMDEYRDEWEEILKKINSDGKDFTKEIMTQLGEVYEEKKDKIEDLRKDSPSLAKEYEEKLLAKLKEFKDKVIQK